MTLPADEPSPDDLLWADTAFKMLCLELEFADTLPDLDQTLSARAQNDFVTYRLNQSRVLYRPMKKVLLYDYVQRPPYRPELELSDLELVVELDRLIAWMKQFLVQINRGNLEPYPPRLLYTYIIDEVFTDIIEDVQGYCPIHYDYEETHESPRLPIFLQCETFINALAASKPALFEICLHNRFINRLLRDKPSFFRAWPFVDALVAEFNEQYEPNCLLDGRVTAIEIAYNEATAEATIELQFGQPDSPAILSSVVGTIYLVNPHKWWYVDRVVVGDWELS